MSAFIKPVENSPIPFAQLLGEITGRGGPLAVGRFCDQDGDYRREYNVYRLEAGDRAYVLKKSDEAEARLYETYLKGRGLPVPEYFGRAFWGGDLWLLLEYLPGPDLRRFTPELAGASARSLAEIQNTYWGGREDGRFQRYWERINRRAQCLKDDPLLAEAYELFLKRQPDCPRTLSSGDFLPLNAIFHGERVYLIDWAFGGTMPYALDIARHIAHGSESPAPGEFPFYMEEAARRRFVEEMYRRLEHKPSWERYVMDLKLAALNEYVEFLEQGLLDPGVSREELETEPCFCYRRAVEAAEGILREAGL